MNSDDIKRIAEIIGLEPKCSEDEPFVCLVRDKDGYAVHFQPDTHWHSTGMLLEWLHKTYADIIIEWTDDEHHSVFKYNYNTRRDDLLGRGKTLQLAICKAVLSVGGDL